MYLDHIAIGDFWGLHVSPFHTAGRLVYLCRMEYHDSITFNKKTLCLGVMRFSEI